jgi:SAM-dependent methyltransferase
VRPASLLDVGCGAGTWLRAAAELGISDLCGIDGVVLAPERLHVARELIRSLDLSKAFFTGRCFDILLCLEVGEHLPDNSAPILISSLVAHSDKIIFSAACPGQAGQHHINCQWPSYWQHLFNAKGFACDDLVRWQIWDDERIEPWYRQNMFVARRDGNLAGREPRIRSVIHPSLLGTMYHALDSRAFAVVEGGEMPLSWYFKVAPKVMVAKIRRKTSQHDAKSTQTRSAGS